MVCRLGGSLNGKVKADCWHLEGFVLAWGAAVLETITVAVAVERWRKRRPADRPLDRSLALYSHPRAFGPSPPLPQVPTNPQSTLSLHVFRFVCPPAS